MEFKDLQNRALEIMSKYEVLNEKLSRPEWSASEYVQALMADVGDLAKLIMAKNNFRSIPDLDRKLEHELSDCLWAICVLAKKLNIDLETNFMKTMDQIEEKISDNL